MATDKNGLTLSTRSDSGYKFVTTFFDGPLKGKFIAFADVVGDERQHKNTQSGKRIEGFFGFKNVLALSIHDDVRDAAYVGQTFYGESNTTRNTNIDLLLEGNESVVPKIISVKWEHDPDVDHMKKAEQRAANRVKLDVQQALANFYKENGTDYKVSGDDAKYIRAAMNRYLSTVDHPKNDDVMEAAKLAFETYRK